MPTYESQSPEQSLDQLLSDETGLKVIMAILKAVPLESEDKSLNVDNLEIEFVNSELYDKSGLISVYFHLYTKDAIGGDEQLPVNELDEYGFNAEIQENDYTDERISILRLSTEKYRELAEAKCGDTSRDAVKDVLSGPNKEQNERINAVTRLVYKEVENNSGLVVQAGKLKVMRVPVDRIGIRLQMNGSKELDMEGGVVIDTKTGEVIFHPSDTSCNKYLKDHCQGASAAEIADDFIKQLQASQ